MKRNPFGAWLLAFGSLAGVASAGPASQTTTVTVASGDPVVIANYEPGDQLTITVLLNSLDQDENREGEPLVIPGVGSVSTHALETTLQYRASDVGVPGVLTAYISGFDGDESATITIARNSLEERLFPTEDKLRMHKAAQNFLSAAALATEWAFTCPFTTIAAPECLAIFGTTAALGVKLGLTLNQIASHDPSDPHFNAIAQPKFPRVLALSNSAYAPALNAVFANESQVIGYLEAASVSMDRAQGAFEAGDETWRLRQIEAMVAYMDKTAQLLDQDLTLRAKFIETWTSAGFPSATASAGDILNMEANVSAQGLPPSMLAAFSLMGESDATIERARRLMTVQSTDDSAGTFPNDWLRPSLVTMLQDYLRQRAQIVGVRISNQTIHLRSAAAVPVRIVATPSFNPREEVDVTSLRFGSTGAEDSLSNCRLASIFDDVRRIGRGRDKDLVCLFRIQDAAFTAKDTQGILTGRTVKGQSLRGVARLPLQNR